MTSPLISVIVPVLNEGATLETTLKDWQARKKQESIELIVVDGGSSDHSLSSAKSAANLVLRATPGRARQMNLGAEAAKGKYLLFLHADTYVSADAFSALCDLAARQDFAWGFFRVRLENSRLIFRIIETLMHWRATVTSVATGDQCLFVSKKLFESQKGFQEIPLMEDVEICKRLRKKSNPTIIKGRVITSARRWERDGVIATVLLMWRLRLAYFLGASPENLHRQYYG